MKKYLNRDFIEGALIFLVIQPAIFIFAVVVFVSGFFQ